jgi:hypothetical protein
MIATPASLRSDFIHIVGMAIHIAPERTNTSPEYALIASKCLPIVIFQDQSTT